MYKLIVATFFTLANAYIEKVPGNIPNSYLLPPKENNLWACPINSTGVQSEESGNNIGIPESGSGSTEGVRLMVSLCYRSSWQVLKCNWSTGPDFLTLKRGEPAKIVDMGQANPFWFNTTGLAQLVGEQVCVSWRYIKDRRDKVESVKCGHSCFRKKHGPVYISWMSGLRSFTAYAIHFEVVGVVGNSGKTLCADLRVSVVLLVILVAAMSRT